MREEEWGLAEAKRRKVNEREKESGLAGVKRGKVNGTEAAEKPKRL
jgi:hypothetical protein